MFLGTSNSITDLVLEPVFKTWKLIDPATAAICIGKNWTSLSAAPNVMPCFLT